MIPVELITAPGCSKCVSAKRIIEKVLKENKHVAYKELSLLDHPELALKYNIMSTPALIINGVLAFSQPPSEKQLKEKLVELIK
jgi:glutaredoxin